MQDFFTLDALLAYPTAVIAVTLVTTVVAALGGDVVQPALKWLALVASLALAGLAAYLATPAAWTNYVVAFFNGLVIFLAATGTNTLLVERKPQMRIFGTPDVANAWRQSWF